MYRDLSELFMATQIFFCLNNSDVRREWGVWGPRVSPLGPIVLINTHAHQQ